MVKRKQSKRGAVKQSTKPNKLYPAKELNLVLYWTTLLVLLVASMVLSIAIVPLLFFASSLQFYLTIAILALVFGYVFSLLITRIENLDVHHHMLAVLFVPFFAAVNIIITSTSISGLALILEIETAKNPLIASTLYAAFFALPYLIILARKKPNCNPS